jgi:hypothetical protein
LKRSLPGIVGFSTARSSEGLIMGATGFEI